MLLTDTQILPRKGPRIRTKTEPKFVAAFPSAMIPSARLPACGTDVLKSSEKERGDIRLCAHAVAPDSITALTKINPTANRRGPSVVFPTHLPPKSRQCDSASVSEENRASKSLRHILAGSPPELICSSIPFVPLCSSAHPVGMHPPLMG